MSFKEWLYKEATTTSATTTSNIAQFKMPVGLIIRRKWPLPTKKDKLT